MLGSILVPLDGSPFGEHALPMAVGLARRAGAELHLVHVHQMIPPATIEGVAIYDAVDLHHRQDEQAYLADVSRRLGEKARVKTALLDGDVGTALKDYAATVAADLVVMSTHGRGAIGRFWLGSVADKLLHEMQRPVLLVHPGEGKPDLNREMTIRNILVPLDGSDLAEDILAQAKGLAGLFGGALTLLRVVPPVIRPSYLREGSGIAELAHSALEKVQAMQRQKMEEAQQYLNRVSDGVASKGCGVRARVTLDEEPALAIKLEADACFADLIAMESHDRPGLSRLFRGSIADKVVRGSHVPVLLHRRKS